MSSHDDADLNNTFMVELPGGFQAGGKTYRRGDRAPLRYREQLEPARRPRDPASGTGVAPTLGQSVVPHIYTFSGLTSTLARTYRNHDEAIRDSIKNAHAMLNDPVISGPLQARQRMVSLLNWSIEAEDPKDKKLKEASDVLTEIVRKTPRFTEYLRTLSEAIWYGRYAVSHQAGIRRNRDGRRQFVIRKWFPISGDKLVFRYDDGSGKYDPDGVGVRVSMAHINSYSGLIFGAYDPEFTPEGPVVFLEKWERQRIAIHKHMIRDGEYEDPVSGSMVHGVGIRNFLYWTWYQKQETLAQLMEIIERTAMGFTIYYYPTGNDTYKQNVEKVAREQGKTNIILMPYDPAMPNMPSIEQIPMNSTGIAALQGIVDNYFADWITRFILGQTLSMKAGGTGLGSGLSDLQHDSMRQIVKYDAAALEESVTTDLVARLRDWNLPKFRDVDFFFRLKANSSIPQEEMAALSQLWQMGAKLDASEMLEKVGMSTPEDDDDVLFNPQIVQQIEAAKNPQSTMMGGMPGMPPGGGGGAPGMPPGGGMPPGMPPVPPPPGRGSKHGPEVGDEDGGDADESGAPSKNAKKYAAAGGLPPLGGGNSPGNLGTSEVPREGETRTNQAGHQEILRGGHWHLANPNQEASGGASGGAAPIQPEQPPEKPFGHGPAGGITLGGRDFAPGEHIPKSAWDAATPDEKKAYETSKPHSAKSIKDLPPGTSIGTDHLGREWVHDGGGQFSAGGQTFGITDMMKFLPQAMGQSVKKYNSELSNTHSRNIREIKETRQAFANEKASAHSGDFDTAQLALKQLQSGQKPQIARMNRGAMWMAEVAFNRGYNSPEDIQKAMSVGTQALRSAESEEHFAEALQKYGEHQFPVKGEVRQPIPDQAAQPQQPADAVQSSQNDVLNSLANDEPEMTPEEIEARDAPYRAFGPDGRPANPPPQPASGEQPHPANNATSETSPFTPAPPDPQGDARMAKGKAMREWAARQKSQQSGESVPPSGQSSPQPQSAPAQPAAPLQSQFIDVRQQGDQFKNATGHVDNAKLGQHVRDIVANHLAAGGKASLWMDGKQVPINEVKLGMMWDNQGRSWGHLPLTMGGGQPGSKTGIELHGSQPWQPGTTGGQPPPQPTPASNTPKPYPGSAAAKAAAATGATGTPVDPAHLGDLPIGTRIGDWERINEPSLGFTAWENKKENRLAGDHEFAESITQDDLNNAQRPQVDQGKESGGPPIHPDIQRKIFRVAQAFGLPAADAKDPLHAGRFVRHAARSLGVNIPGDTVNERTVNAAKFLHRSTQRLDQISQAAANLGWSPKVGTSRINQAASAANHILKSAMQNGWQPPHALDHIRRHMLMGNDKAMKQYQDSLFSAINHMQTSRNVQPGISQVFESLANAVGGKRNLYILAGALALLWFIRNRSRR